MKPTGFTSNATADFLRNDCTVRALSTATGIDYVIMREALAVLGRRPNAGWDIHTWIRTTKHEAFGFAFVPVAQVNLTDTFLCYNRGHAWAVKAGRLVDNVGGGRRPTNVYRVVRNPDGDQSETLLAAARKRAQSYLQD